MAAAREDLSRAPELPYLRSTVLESLRLWPTTPLILRETSAVTTWRHGALPAQTAVVVFAPYFHRDEHHLQNAHVFAPDLWRDGRPENAWPLVPFSGGPGMCPGRNVVLLTCSMVLAELIRARDFSSEKRLDPHRLPGTLSPFSSRFTVTPRG
jgi:cytochrome P450